MGESLTDGIDLDRIPAHIGLILDGNGRWANQRGLPRTAGHAAGEAALFDTIEGAQDLGVTWLTAYTFSTENWSRSDEEVEFLMWFNQEVLIRRRDRLHERNIRILFAGDLDDVRIPERNRELMKESQVLTDGNTSLTMVFAFNYGSRAEIARAARSIASEVAAGRVQPDSVDAEMVSQHLFVPDMPDLDLVIRSSGEHRLSNFLLWQAAYAELAFPGILWPDFDRFKLADAIRDYQTRDRRFGGAVDAVAEEAETQ